MKFVPARHFTPSFDRPIDLIVMHSMESAEKPDTAENVADWFAGPRAPRTSAHVCVDSNSVVQCVKIDDVAWAAPGSNHNGFHIEMAGKASQVGFEWKDPYSWAVMDLSAKVAAEVCRRYKVPVEYGTWPDLKTGFRGITTHREVSEAFKKSTHWDPGPNFPMALFIDMVKHYTGPMFGGEKWQLI